MSRTYQLATFAFLLAVATGSASAGDIASKSLKFWLGDVLSIASNSKGATIEYCPDNTCERLTVPTKNLAGALEDFAFLYLLTRSDYVYLKDRRPSEEAITVARVSSMYSRACPYVDEKPDIDCVLKLLQKRASIRLFFIRYDEGHKCTVPEPLLGKLPVAKTTCVKVKRAA